MGLDIEHTRYKWFGRIGQHLSQHKKVISILILLIVSVGMHLIFFPSILRQENDSNGYLSGAVSLAVDGNLNAVPAKRGPGMALIAWPIFKEFGSNSAIPIKLVLHFFAFGSVILTYGIVLELLKNYWAALLAGVLVAIRPDILVYSDELLSEVPTLFFTSLFAFFAVRFFSRGQVRWLYLAALSVSFLTMIRTENQLQILLLFIFVGMMIFQSFWRGQKLEGIKIAKHGLICLLISLIPIFAWSYHNLQTHGFFGLSNYTHTQIYGGVIMASYRVEQNPPIINLNSPAVKKNSGSIQCLFGGGQEKLSEFSQRRLSSRNIWRL